MAKNQRQIDGQNYLWPDCWPVKRCMLPARRAGLPIRMRDRWVKIYDWAYLRGVSNQEMAEWLGISVGAIKLELAVLREVLWAVGRDLPDRNHLPENRDGGRHRGIRGARMQPRAEEEVDDED
jgi:hypothetical protein